MYYDTFRLIRQVAAAASSIQQALTLMKHPQA